MQIAIIYLLAIVGAESVTNFIQPLWGIVFHIGILVAAILHSALSSGLTNQHRQLVLSLALVPLVRILSLSIPLAKIPQLWWFPIIYAPLIASAIMAVRILGYKVADVGVNFRLSPFQLAVGSTGFGFGVAEYFILRPEAMTDELSLPAVWLPALIFLVFVGFGEELIFRGVLQRTAAEAFGTRGIVYISFLFAMLHMGFRSWIDVVFVFGVALFLGWAVKRTGSLVGVTLSHGLTNIMLYLILPFLLS